jgi:nucleoside-diphosphate-sugar epimerase
LKRVLVTGASGFIGRHTLPFLLERGFTVHAVSRRKVELADVQHHAVNLLEAESVRKLMAEIRPTHLLHAAWYVEPGLLWNAPENADWLQASVGLLDTFCLNGGERVAGLGTCAEYDWSATAPFSERDTPLRPNTMYGAAKACVRDRIAEAGISQVWCRPFFLYGPFEGPERLVPSLTIPLLRGDPALCRNSNAVRDFLHVEDAARAVVSMLDTEHQGAVNICSGKPVRLGEIARMLGELTGHPDLVAYGGGVEVPATIVGDASLLESLGFREVHNLQTGLESAVDWWRRRSI